METPNILGSRINPWRTALSRPIVADRERKTVCLRHVYQNVPPYFKPSRKGSYKPYDQQTELHTEAHDVQSVDTCQVADAQNPARQVWNSLLAHSRKSQWPRLCHTASCKIDNQFLPKILYILFFIESSINFGFQNIALDPYCLDCCIFWHPHKIVCVRANVRLPHIILPQGSITFLYWPSLSSADECPLISDVCLI